MVKCFHGKGNRKKEKTCNIHPCKDFIVPQRILAYNSHVKL